MFQSSILDVAAGIILLYLILALVCTSINEYIAQILNLRAHTLWEGIRSLFQNSSDATKFAQQIYGHDLVDALSPPRANAKPSYIPPDVFSLAVVDLLKLRPLAVGEKIDEKMKQSGVDPNIAQIFEKLTVNANDDIDKFRHNVEMWFDAVMARVSGW